MIASLVFDRGISNLAVVPAETEPPSFLDASNLPAILYSNTQQFRGSVLALVHAGPALPL
jgi:hypothetical protein